MSATSARGEDADASARGEDADAKPLLVLAFDVETTGDRLPVCPLGVHADPPRGSAGGQDQLGDALVSVGWAGGWLAPAAHGGPPMVRVVVEPARLDVDLRKPADVPWGDFWRQKRWSRDAYERFWAARLGTLDATQKNASSFALTASYLNRTLAELEESYEIIPIVDAVGFDAPWINVLLNSQGYEGLGRTRTGRSRRIVDAYSFRLGRALLDHADAAPGHENGSAAAQAAFARQRGALRGSVLYEHPHLADKDAKGILVAYLSSLGDLRPEPPARAEF